MRYVQWERIAAILVSVLSGAVLGYLLLRYALPLLLPFFVAFGVSLMIRPLAKKLSSRLHLPRGLCAAVLLLSVFGLGGWGLWRATVRLLSELGALIERLMSEGGIFDAMDSFMLWIEQIGTRWGILSPGEGDVRQQIYDALMQMVGNLLTSIASRLPELAAALFAAMPAGMLFLLVSVVACFYFCTDGDHITKAIIGILPRPWQGRIQTANGGARDFGRKYVRAYAILLGLTFLLLFVGFLVLGVDYAFLLALLVAIVDILPVLGVGTVLIPWAIVMLVQKEFYLGFGLLILYLAVALIRQIAEPKLLGKTLGLHPLLTLFATYVGFSLFGLLGMLLAPLAALLVKKLIGERGVKSEEL